MKNIKASELGFSLIEILCALAISSIFSLGMMTLSDRAVYACRQLMGISAREIIHSQIEDALKADAGLKKSLALDKYGYLNACFTSNPLCVGQTDYPVDMYDPSGQRITGGPNNPVYYQNDGSRCQDATKNSCPISVISMVRAQSVPYWVTRQYTPDPGGSWMYEIVEVTYVISYVARTNMRDVMGSVTYDTLDTWDTFNATPVQ